MNRLGKIVAIGMMLCSLSAHVLAQEEESSRFAPRITELNFDARGAYDLVAPDMKFDGEQSSVRLQGLFFRLGGEILPGLSYTYIHRLNKVVSAGFLESIDHLHLDWRATSWFGISGGKEVVALGGIEYDYAPIDVYYTSAYYNVVPCYQWGASLRFFPTENDQLQLQVAQSMLRYWAGDNKVNLNLMWHGQHGPWKALWSVSGLQSIDKDWVGYLCIGNRIDIMPWLRLDVDAMMRTGLDKATFTGKDWTFVGELSARPVEQLRVFVRALYDFNLSGNDADLFLADGLKAGRFGFGAEYSPIRNHPEIVRLFAAGCYGWGSTLKDGERADNREFLFQTGLRFRMDILGAYRYAQEKRAKSAQM